MKLFLASRSRVHGAGWLDYLIGDLDRFLGPGIRRALFVPFALFDRQGCWSQARERLAGANLFRRGHDVREFDPGTRLDELL